MSAFSIKPHIWWIRLVLALFAGASLTGLIANRAANSTALTPGISDGALLSAESGFLPPQIQQVLEAQSSPLAQYSEDVGEQTFTAAELFWLASQNEQFGLSPKALLTTFALETNLAWEHPTGLFEQLRQVAAALNDAYRQSLTGQSKVLNGAQSRAEAALGNYFAPVSKSGGEARATLQTWAQMYRQLFNQSPQDDPKGVPLPAAEPFLRLPFDRTASQYYPLEAWFDHAAPGQISETTILRFDGLPLPGAHYTACWQWVTCYSGHNATDFTLPTGTPVYAAAAGKVITRIDSEGGLVIDHPNGYRTIYWHLDRIALTRPYQQVEQGQLLGWSGNRGTSPHPHLHFGLRQTALSRDVDPFGWIGANPDPWLVTSRWMWAGDAIADDLETQAHLFYGPDWIRSPLGYQGGSWYTWSTANPNTSTNWGVWGATLPKPGVYTVYGYWPRHAENTTSAAFKVQTARGMVIVTANQRDDGDRWVKLGTFEMNAGPVVVILTDVTADKTAERRVVFDAVRWGEQYELYLPAVTK